MSDFIQDAIYYDSLYLHGDNKLVETGEKIMCNVTINGEKHVQYMLKKDLIAAGISITLEKDSCHSVESNLHPQSQQNNPNPDSQRSSEKDDSEECSSESKVWNVDNTKFLLSKYAEYLPLVGPMKKFKNKAALFKQVATDINDKFGSSFTGDQCNWRFKTVGKRKNVAVKRNRTSGNSRTKVEYQDELAEVAAVDDSFQPEVKLAPGRVEVLDKPTSRFAKCRKVKKDEDKTIWKIHEERKLMFEKKEEAKQKRHVEKMALLQQLFKSSNNNTTGMNLSD